MAQDTYYREVNAKMSNEVLAISVIEFRVVRRTPKGCWIVPTYWHGHDNQRRFEKFVLDGEGQRYAYPTRKKARESFIIRKQREIQHCAAQHDRAVRYLKLAETGKFGSQNEALHEIRSTDILLPEVMD